MAEQTLFDQPWLWQDRIPVGGLTVVATPSGGDASPVIADLAARVTAGLAFPGDNRPQNVPNSRLARRVVVVTAGGDPRYGIGRQIERAGGRIDQLQVVNGLLPGSDRNSPDIDPPGASPEERNLSLPGDLKLLRELILVWNRREGTTDVRTPQEQPSVGLLVIESLPFHVEKWREAELRTLFDRLNRLAVELNLAVVVLSPLSTDPARVRAGKVTLAKALGSAALVEAAAALWQIQPLADHSDGFEFVPLKSRKKTPPCTFRLGNDAVPGELPASTVAAALPAPANTVRIATTPAFPTSPRTAPSVAAGRTRPNEQFESNRDQIAPSSVAPSSADRPVPSHGLPRPRTVTEIRKSPEWKRASRIERKRMLRAATIRPSAASSRDNEREVGAIGKVPAPSPPAFVTPGR